jgi:PAS domain S-box-containing protein
MNYTTGVPRVCLGGQNQAMDHARLRAAGTSMILRIATVALALGTFLVDTQSSFDIAVGALYLFVVLLAARVYGAPATIAAAAGCVVLLVLSTILTGHIGTAPGMINTALRATSIVAVTVLALRDRSSSARLEQQAALLDLAHEAVIVRDFDGTIRYWNRGAEEMYGWAAAEATGMSTNRLLKTAFPAPLDDIGAQLVKSRRWEGDLVHTRRDGTTLTVTSRWAMRGDGSPEMGAVMEINSDVTARKRAEEELQRANRDLEQRVQERTRGLESANKELEAFAYSVSHDLRAPLRHLGGFAELLQKHAGSALDEKSRRYTLMIVESASRMGNLIDDLLAFSRVGRAEIAMTTVALEQVVREAWNEVRRDIDGRDIVWKVGALPSVSGDRAMLRVAWLNLISNALKFTRPRAHAHIEVGTADSAKSECVVFIKDDGVGFNMKYVNKLFGVFQRLHRTEDFEGTGIGLATVQRIVHRHGGRVWAESRENEGTTFYVALPKAGGTTEWTT